MQNLLIFNEPFIINIHQTKGNRVLINVLISSVYRCFLVFNLLGFIIIKFE
jgi:hypothetical protein